MHLVGIYMTSITKMHGTMNIKYVSFVTTGTVLIHYFALIITFVYILPPPPHYSCLDTTDLRLPIEKFLPVEWAVQAQIVHLLDENQLQILRVQTFIYEGWNFNSGNYFFTTDTK